MDKNEGLAKELASHISRLSCYLKHFKTKISDAQEAEDMAAHIDNLHKYVDFSSELNESLRNDILSRELECVQTKVNQWKSSGRFKKAFLSSEHAEELQGHQDIVQNALEEMQVCVLLLLVVPLAHARR